MTKKKVRDTKSIRLTAEAIAKAQARHRKALKIARMALVLERGEHEREFSRAEAILAQLTQCEIARDGARGEAAAAKRERDVSQLEATQLRTYIAELQAKLLTLIEADETRQRQQDDVPPDNDLPPRL